MKLRLKEEPREWRKFGVNSALVLALITGFLCWRGWLGTDVTLAALAALAGAALLAWLRPPWFRRPYRWGMRLSHVLGRWIAPLILGAIFFGVVTPLGLLLRALGKDLLRLRREPGTASYWQPPSGSKDLRKMY